jgi:hypothetical protein
MKYQQEPSVREALQEFIDATAEGSDGGIIDMANMESRVRFYDRIKAVRSRAESALSKQEAATPAIRDALQERAKRLARELVQLDCSEAALVRCFNAIDDLAAMKEALPVQEPAAWLVSAKGVDTPYMLKETADYWANMAGGTVAPLYRASVVPADAPSPAQPEAREALREIEKARAILKDPRWGQWSYMEGCDVYEDIGEAVEALDRARAALSQGAGS